MSSLSPNVGAITLFVEDPRRSKAFYRGVFDLDPIYEDEEAVAFRLENVTLNLLVRSSANELVTPSHVAQPGSGSQFELTIEVANADEACATLKARGVTLLNGPIDRPWGVRTAAFADPDGYVWEVAANLPRS
ncbi:MAG: VOC family protein [Chloroflexi bacterium]|nr:VOC family protein [Chloroflexota bacterium]